MQIINHPCESSKRLRVAAYCRVSTKQSSQEESYETQQSYYRKLITDNPEWEFVGIYSDVKSGTSAEKRPGFQKMMHDSLSGQIDLIIVKSLSRFSRNLGVFENAVRLLKENGVRIWFEKEDLYTDSEQTKLILSIMAALAEQESYSISENIKWTYRERSRQGLHNLGNNRVLGYDCKDGALTPNKDAWIIKKIFQMFIDGFTYKEIENALYQAGARSIFGNTIGTTAIYNILRNEIYVGDRLLQKGPPRDFYTKKPSVNVPYDSYYLENDHPGIVGRDVWNKAQKRISDMRYPQNQIIGNNRPHHYLFGYVVCGKCGAYGTRRTFKEYQKKEARKIPYKSWGCSNYYRFGETRCSNHHGVRESLIIQGICDSMGWEYPQDGQFNPHLLYENIEKIVISGTRGVEVIKR